MKINLQNLFSILALFSLLFSSCEKDYRDLYSGRWRFDVTNTHDAFNTLQGFHDTTEYSSYVGIIKDGINHDRIIFVSSGYSREFTIDKYGMIIPDPSLGVAGYESGKFENKNFFRYYYRYQSIASPHNFLTILILGERI